MIYWTALILGLAGSLHCAGMCGPLAMALPVPGRDDGPRPFPAWMGRVFYNLGRMTTYVSLGLVFGLAGKSLVLAGWQRWVSLAAGSAILLGFLISLRFNLGIPATRLVGRLKPWFGPLLRRPSLKSSFLLGLLNGWLPCGLVYVACAGAVASGGTLSGGLYMGIFGAGTVPVMFGLGMFGSQLQRWLRFRLQSLIPLSLFLVGFLLILRGLALDLPYVSPGPLEVGTPACCSGP